VLKSAGEMDHKQLMVVVTVWGGFSFNKVTPKSVEILTLFYIKNIILFKKTV